MDKKNNIQKRNKYQLLIKGLLNKPSYSLLSEEKKISHTLSMINDYYRRENKVILGKLISPSTRHLKYLTTKVVKNEVLFLLVFLKKDLEYINKILIGCKLSKLSDTNLDDVIYKYIIKNQNSKNYCMLILRDILKKYVLTDVKIAQFIKDLNKEYPYMDTYIIKNELELFDQYISSFNIKRMGSKEKTEKVNIVREVLNSFFESNYYNDKKTKIKARGILTMNLSSGDSRNSPIHSVIETYIESCLYSKQFAPNMLRETVISLAFYSGMDPIRIDKLLKKLKLKELDKNTFFDSIVINLFEKIHTLNPNLFANLKTDYSFFNSKKYCHTKLENKEYSLSNKDNLEDLDYVVKRADSLCDIVTYYNESIQTQLFYPFNFSEGSSNV